MTLRRLLDVPDCRLARTTRTRPFCRLNGAHTHARSDNGGAVHAMTMLMPTYTHTHTMSITSMDLFRMFAPLCKSPIIKSIRERNDRFIIDYCASPTFIYDHFMEMETKRACIRWIRCVQ